MPMPYYSSVTLYQNVPLDPMYKHTLTFANKAAQTAYFETKKAANYDFTLMSYIRYQSGVIKVQATMDIVDKVNYLRFINTANENKNFYAFVTSIQYISETVVAISFEVDVLQTWMFDYTLNPCYVEREHTNDDTIGANRVAEGLETGDYINPVIEKIKPWDSIYSDEYGDAIQNTTFVIVATQDPQGNQYSYQYNGVASSMYVTFAYDTAGLENVLQAFRSGVTQSLEPIVSISMMPSYFKPNVSSPLNPTSYTLRYVSEFGLNYFFGYNGNQGTKMYVPKNNKLYTYPYNFLTFESPDGSSTTLKYEDFRDPTSITFGLTASILPDVETCCCPVTYEGPIVDVSTAYQMSKALYSKAYPTCAVASDAFDAWWAQNKYNNPVVASTVEAVSAATNTPSVATSDGPFNSDKANKLWNGISNFGKKVWSGAKAALTGDTMPNALASTAGALGSMLTASSPAAAVGSILNVAGDIANQNAAYQGHKAVPDTMVTKANNGGVNHYEEWDCYKVLYTKIRPEQAEVIDNYFSCFGYATHIVKVPNVTGRRNWNYVQTIGCTISGNVPAEVNEQICAIYDKGVTFWHIPANIHNYNANNDII